VGIRFQQVVSRLPHDEGRPRHRPHHEEREGEEEGEEEGEGKEEGKEEGKVPAYTKLGLLSRAR